MFDLLLEHIRGPTEPKSGPIYQSIADYGTVFNFPEQIFPLIECPLLFPGGTTSIHISEPRHRVLIKRTLETTKQFGIVLPHCVRSGMVEFGTLCEIVEFEPLLSLDIVSTCEGNLPR